MLSCCYSWFSGCSLSSSRCCGGGGIPVATAAGSAPVVIVLVLLMSVSCCPTKLGSGLLFCYPIVAVVVIVCV